MWNLPTFVQFRSVLECTESGMRQVLSLPQRSNSPSSYRRAPKRHTMMDHSAAQQRIVVANLQRSLREQTFPSLARGRQARRKR